MKLSTKLVMLAGVLALAACTNPDRFGADGANGGIGGTGMNGGMVPGSANDPTSVAYFQQSVGDRVLFQVDQSTLTPKVARPWTDKPHGSARTVTIPPSSKATPTSRAHGNTTLRWVHVVPMRRGPI